MQSNLSGFSMSAQGWTNAPQLEAIGVPTRPSALHSMLIGRLRSPSSAASRSASTNPANAVSVNRGASTNPTRSLGERAVSAGAADFLARVILGIPAPLSRLWCCRIG